MKVLRRFIAATLCIIVAGSSGYAQSKSAIQFYDTNGTNKTGKVGWTGDATTGHLFMQTPADGEVLKTQNGGISVTGTITATRFTGDGSSLTNLPASAVTVGSVTGLTDSLNKKANIVDVTKKADTTSVYLKAAVNTLLGGKADTGNVYTKTAANTLLSRKADTGTVNAALNAKAPINAAAFTGQVTISNVNNEGLKIEYPSSGLNPQDYISLFRGEIHFADWPSFINDDSIKSTANPTPFGFGYSKDMIRGSFDFYAKVDGTRSGNAAINIYGNETNNFTHRLSLTHDGTKGIISTGFGNIDMQPATGVLSVNGIQVATSDVRYKTNIRPLDSSLQKVAKLRGVSYEFKRSEFPDKKFPKGKQIGLIAQEVEPIVPEVVLTDTLGYKSLAYDRLVALLINATNEQQKIIAQQGMEIENLKQQMSKVMVSTRSEK